MRLEGWMQHSDSRPSFETRRSLSSGAHSRGPVGRSSSDERNSAHAGMRFDISPPGRNRANFCERCCFATTLGPILWDMHFCHKR
jgi:hypothetical protein